jgi:uncharacterized iron-regulated membrane protein
MKPGEQVIWHQSRKWGGKQNQAVIFLGLRGKISARIKLDGREFTVRLSSLTPLYNRGSTGNWPGSIGMV